jgi:hypothetical protein
MGVERESVNFKLPKSLVEELRAKAKELDTSATELVMRGLEHVLNLTDGSIDHNGKVDIIYQLITRIEVLEGTRVTSPELLEIEDVLYRMEKVLVSLSQNIEQSIESSKTKSQQAIQLNHLEEKLETVANNLEQLNNLVRQVHHKGNRGAGQFVSSPHQFQSRQVELKSSNGENLAKRLGVDELSLTRERDSKSQSEFESWSRRRDPGSRGWRFGEDALYYPVG